MTGLLGELRYALRTLRRSPGFAAVAIATLALGIGANTAIFSMVDAVLLRPLPFPHPERLALLWEKTADLPTMMVAYPDYLDWRDQSGAFESLAVYNRYRSLNLTGAGEPERVPAAAVSSNFWKTVGVEPALGRGFLPDGAHPGRAEAVLLDGFFERRFGRDPATVGKTLTLDGAPVTVVGVMPRGYRYPTGVEMLVPLGVLGEKSLESRDTHPGLVAIGRLKRDMPLSRAREEMRTIAGRLAASYPKSNAGVGAEVQPLSEMIVGGARATLLLLLGAVGFVLLIACANVASLLLARALSRGKEIAVRAALGAGRWRLVRQLLIESVVLSLAGGSLGLLAGNWSASLLSALAPKNLPGALDAGVDARGLAFTFLLSLSTGLLFGLAPALKLTRGSIQTPLQEEAWGVAGGVGRRRSRGLLVAAEVALSLLLLVGAGLMLRSFVNLKNAESGFDPSGVVVGNVSLPAGSYATQKETHAFFDRALERLKASPGVRAAAAGDPLPFGSGGWQVGITVEGVANPAPGQNPIVDAAAVSPDYFRALGIPLSRGRFFSAADDDRVPAVVIVDRAMAERFWPGADPLGRRLKFGPEESTGPWMPVVGVVGDVKLVSLSEKSRPRVYFSTGQQPVRALTLIARFSSSQSASPGALRAAVQSVDGSLPVWDVSAMETLLEESVSPRRFSTGLFTGFAALALLLALIGIYGVLSHFVARRHREIGLRMTLGAEASDVVRLVVGEGIRPILLGLAAGLLGAVAMSRLLARLLFQVSPTDPLTLLAAPLLLAAVGLLASYLPARRAAAISPMEALRNE